MAVTDRSNRLARTRKVANNRKHVFVESEIFGCSAPGHDQRVIVGKVEI